MHAALASSWSELVGDLSTRRCDSVDTSRHRYVDRAGYGRRKDFFSPLFVRCLLAFDIYAMLGPHSGATR